MLYLIWIGSNERAFQVDGPFDEGDTDAIYAKMDEVEKLYNLHTLMPKLYGKVTLKVVRTAHTQEYRT